MDAVLEKKILLDEKKQRDVAYYMPKEEVLQNLANFFSIFSDATRIKILSALSVSEMCVNDIATLLQLNQTTVSHQLKSLKNIGAVKCKRDGKVVFYSIANSQINNCLLSGVEYLYE
jgi:ArsR family transcriptional regulator